MEKIYRDADVDMSVLKGKTIAVIDCYGIQGQGTGGQCPRLRLQSHHWHPSRFPNQIPRAGQDGDGFEAFDIFEATKKADVLLIELADPVQPAIYKKDIAPNLKAGQTLCFCCTAVSVLYGQITPPPEVNVVTLCPPMPPAALRSLRENI